MRNVTFKQSICISETDAGIFQEKMNAALSQIPNPEIVFDNTLPMTAYIFYRVSKDQPETLLELLEMLDTKTQGRATCEICQHFERSEDRRKKWGTCRKYNKPIHMNGRACEAYYLELREVSAKLIEEYRQIPFLIDGANNR